ncbi:MAG: beta-1,6-N-acetylglucosaminyltransferase [Microbacter sp.]
MINKTYLILAHQNPNQLKRLIERLNDENSFFFIHIDKKSDIEPFTNIIKGNHIQFLVHRINCLWGDFSQITATISLMEEAIKSKRDGMIIHLTGQDYPIKSLDEINRFLENHSHENFIDALPIGTVWKYFTDRTEYYKLNLSDKRGDYVIIRNISRKSLNLFFHGKISLWQLLMLQRKRKLKPDMEHFGGSAWWAFNAETHAKMYQFIKQHYNSLFQYYRYSIFPDEIFMQTIVKNLSRQDPSIKIAPSITYVNWTRHPNAASPLTFSINDLDELKSQPMDKLFARKFDTTFDEHILNALDAFNSFTNK